MSTPAGPGVGPLRPYDSREFAITTAREAERRFLLIQTEFHSAERTFGEVSQSIRRIQTSNAVLDRHTDGLAGNQSASPAHNEPGELYAAMFRNCAGPDNRRLVLANFPKWESGPYPPNIG